MSEPPTGSTPTTVNAADIAKLETQVGILIKSVEELNSSARLSYSEFKAYVIATAEKARPNIAAICAAVTIFGIVMGCMFYVLRLEMDNRILALKVQLLAPSKTLSP